jgi:ethanolamine utilization protein EutN
MNGWKLLVAQPLTVDEKPDGEPILVIDDLGAGLNDRVIVCNDGAGTRTLMGSKNSPVRWFVMGICDAHR